VPTGITLVIDFVVPIHGLWMAVIDLYASWIRYPVFGKRTAGCTKLRSILSKAHLSSIIFERDVEGLYNLLKDCLQQPQLNDTGFDPGRIRQHGLTQNILIDTIIDQWEGLLELYGLLLHQIYQQNIAVDWCSQHVSALRQISAATKSRHTESLPIQRLAPEHDIDRSQRRIDFATEKN